MRRRIRSEADQRGYVTTEFLGAVLLSMLILVGLVNVIFIQYGRGVMRAAADEGARAGSRYQSGDHPAADASTACRERIRFMAESLGKLGKIREPVDCKTAGGGIVRAEIKADFDVWLPGAPDITLTATSRSVSENYARRDPAAAQ